MLFFFTINSIKIQYFIFPYIFEVITAAYVCGYLSRQKNMINKMGQIVNNLQKYYQLNYEVN